MEVSEIPSPTFVVNEQGRVSVFLPSFEGEPENPAFTILEENAVLFDRTPKENCFLTALSDETMSVLKKNAKCLVIEVSLEKTLDMMENNEEAENFGDTFERMYEVSVK